MLYTKLNTLALGNLFDKMSNLDIESCCQILATIQII